jgi:3-methylcrotonyl-CoA carboxylase alpha subunit
MPGRIVSVVARAGEAISKGQPVLSLEAMKMEHTLTAPFDGTVAEIAVKVGEQVPESALLARIDQTK